MLRLILALALAATFTRLPAQEAGPALAGRIDGRTYVSPTGMFKVAIPVLPELGGDVTDTPDVVTFRDDFNLYVSIAAFKQDATQRWEYSTRGPKDYLIYFFGNFVLPDFKQIFDGASIESAKFVPSMLGGALLTYILVPGGTMFVDRVPPFGWGDRMPVAKRGNLLFVKNETIFVISAELAERVVEGRAYDKTTEQEDEILRRRLMEIVDRMQFTIPPPPSLEKK